MNKKEQLTYIETHVPFERGIHSVREIRHSFFKNVSTEIQAYLLGFFVADGNINEKRKTLRIHLQEQDKNVVNLYRDFIAPTARTFTIKEHFAKGRDGKQIVAHQSYGIDINSSALCNDLLNLGFGYAKSWKNLHLPKINNELIRHFIRGVFDGDGCISVYYCKPDIKWKKKERVRAYASICSETDTLLLEIQQVLKENNIKSSMCKTTRDNMYVLTVPKSQIRKLYEFFYTDSYFWLDRKFNKFNHYVNTEEIQLIAELRNA